MFLRAVVCVRQSVSIYVQWRQPLTKRQMLTTTMAVALECKQIARVKNHVSHLFNRWRLYTFRYTILLPWQMIIYRFAPNLFSILIEANLFLESWQMSCTLTWMHQKKILSTDRILYFLGGIFSSQLNVTRYWNMHTKWRRSRKPEESANWIHA